MAKQNLKAALILLISDHGLRPVLSTLAEITGRWALMHPEQMYFALGCGPCDESGSRVTISGLLVEAARLMVDPKKETERG